MAKPKTGVQVDPRRSVLVNAARLIAQRVDEMLAYEPCLADADNVRELHEMRIAGKRLRYTMEVFHPIYALYTHEGAEYGSALLAVKNLQEHLGVLHDADVLVPEILEHLGRMVKSGYGLPAGDGQDGQHTRNKHKARETGKSQKAAAPKACPNATDEVLPIVGVHNVSYPDCEGLLTLCAQLRDERDTRFALLTQEWQHLREQKVFEGLRALLLRTLPNVRKNGGKGTAEGKRKKEKEESSALPLAALDTEDRIPNTEHPTPSASEDVDAAIRQIPQTQRAPGEPGHIAAARRRTPPHFREERNAKREPDGTREGQKGRGRNTPAPAKIQPAKSGSGRNGTTRATRHSRTGADPNPGAGKGGAG